MLQDTRHPRDPRCRPLPGPRQLLFPPRFCGTLPHVRAAAGARGLGERGGGVRGRLAAGCADPSGEVTPLSEKQKHTHTPQTQAGSQGEPRKVPTLKSAWLVTSSRKYTKARGGQESRERGGAAIGRRAADAR